MSNSGVGVAKKFETMANGLLAMDISGGSEMEGSETISTA